MGETDSTAILYISGLAFLACFFAVLGISGLAEFLRARKELHDRVVGGTNVAAKPDSELTGFGYIRERFYGLLKKLGEANQEKVTDAQGSALAQRLASAGFRREAGPAMLMGTKVVAGILFPLLTFVLPIPALDEAPITQALFVYVLLAGVGLYIPEIVLHQIRSKRQTLIINGFPDALDLLVVCIEAGLGLDAAIFRTGKELAIAHPALCEELRLVSLELRAGLPRAQALNNFAWRADVPEVKSLVSLLIQTDRFGTSVGLALRVHSDAMRVARTQRAEEMAGKLPVKLLFPLMFFIFPSIFIVILGPAVIQGIRILLPTMGASR